MFDSLTIKAKKIGSRESEECDMHKKKTARYEQPFVPGAGVEPARALLPTRF